MKWKKNLIYTLCLKEWVRQLSTFQHECLKDQFLLVWYPDWKLNVLLVWRVSFCQKGTDYEKALDFDIKDAPGKIAMKTDQKLQVWPPQENT